MKTVSADKLFTPIQVGPMELKHRVVMAPLKVRSAGEYSG
jgi:2,4-dienoyl-CoA reductase-like NADH-dependent reductase (Old Yellow Enzyme family)